MRAIICKRYGPPEVLELADVAKPEPKKNDIIIKNMATAVTASDTIVRGFKLPRFHPIGIAMSLAIGIRGPRQPILGMIVSGIVEQVGSDVTHYKEGDEIYGWTLGEGAQIQFGSYAEYVRLSENGVITPKPPQASFAEAAAIPYGSGMATFYLNKGNLQAGQRVLIYGASGAIGTMAVQLAKTFDVEVTGVCSGQNIEMVKALGADKVLDYTVADAHESLEQYDFVLDAVGQSKGSLLKDKCQEALTPTGMSISVDDGSPKTLRKDAEWINSLYASGQIQAVIDSHFPLEQMAEAHRYVDLGHKKGNVIIDIFPPETP